MKLGCFLTGYNYNILNKCSEASSKHLKKVTSAMLIIMMVWGFIGYTFTGQYMHLGTLGQIIGAIVLIVIVVQIERQIILTIGENILAKKFRIAIAVIMAILGSIIVDQIVFKEDIENQKIEYIQTKIKNILPNRVAEIDEQIANIDSLIFIKELDRNKYQLEFDKNPRIKDVSSETRRVTKKVPRTKILNGEKRTVMVDSSYTESASQTKQINNPKLELIGRIDLQIDKYRIEKDTLYKHKIDARELLTKELMEKNAFLDELQIMLNLLTSSNIAAFVWFLWFAFFLCIELFVLMCKSTKDETDYDKIIKHQMDTKIRMLNELK